MKITLPLIIALLILSGALAPGTVLAGGRGSQLSAGPVFAKVHNGQWENGLELSWTHDRLWSRRIGFHTVWTSNEFGTGIASEKVFTKHNIMIHTRLNFLPARLVDPWAGIRAGYSRTFFDDTDPVEKLFNEMYEQNTLVYGINLGIRWNLHPIYGGPVTGIQYDLTELTGVSFPMTTFLSWSFPVFPRKL